MSQNGHPSRNGTSSNQPIFVPSLNIPPPVELKKKLNQIADFQQYSRIIKKFLVGNINKSEFHSEISKILPTREKCMETIFLKKKLTRLSVALHNWLILSILKNSYSKYNNQIKKSLNNRPNENQSNDLKTISEYPTFKKRIVQTCHRHLINDVSDDAISMVIVALQRHLMRIISSLKADPFKAPEILEPPENNDVLKTSKPMEISSNDVIGSVWREPKLLCDNQSIIQYKMSMDL